MKSFAANWKTTALGAGAVLSASGHLLTAIGTGDWSLTTITIDLAAISSGLGLLFAKDGDVTGGTVKQ
jgi:hypothetical protein